MENLELQETLKHVKSYQIDAYECTPGATSGRFELKLELFNGISIITAPSPNASTCTNIVSPILTNFEIITQEPVGYTFNPNAGSFTFQINLGVSELTIPPFFIEFCELPSTINTTPEIFNHTYAAPENNFDPNLARKKPRTINYATHRNKGPEIFRIILNFIRKIIGFKQKN